MKIPIGKSGPTTISLDVDKLLSTRLLVQANSGKGKSHLLRRIAEQLFGKVPVIIVDPEGEFATLREKFGYVLVGKGGETPADPRSAGLVAHKLLELRASAVCDIYELKPATRHLWVKSFLDAMIDAPKNLWHPCVVIVDEAHVFCPEKGSGESEASEAMIGLATRGRKRGFASIFATQRLGKLRKDAAAELLNIVVGGTFIDVDRKRAADALGVYGTDLHKFFDEIKVMEPGYFFALGPAISVDRVLVHVGEVATTHPKAGSAKHGDEPPPAPEAIAKLLPKLADLPKAAEEKARTEADLRREIRDLKNQMRTAPGKSVDVKVADPKAIDRAVRPLKAMLEEAMKVIVKVNAIGFDQAGMKPEEVAKAFEATAREISRISKAGLEKRAAEFDRLKREANLVLSRLKSLLEKEDVAVTVDVRHNQPFTVSPASAAPRKPVESNGDLSRPQMKILAALAEFQAIGVNEPNRSMVASWCGVKAGTGSFKNYLSELRVRGYIADGRDERLSLTPEGERHAPEVASVMSTEELLQRSASIFGATPAKILRLIHAEHPNFVEREKLGNALGISSETGSFKNYISELRTAGMIEDGPDRSLKAADWLFIG